MTGRAAALGVMLVVAVVGPGAGARAQDAKKGYRTPQEAFDAFTKAAAKADYATFYSTLEPAASDKLVGMFALIAVHARADLDRYGSKMPERVRAMLRPVAATAERFGLEKFRPLAPKAEKAEQDAWVRKAVAAVRKKPEFFAAALTALEKAREGGAGMKELGTARLEGVKIDGDAARGTVVNTKDELEKKSPIEFRRVNGSWLIIPPIAPGGKK